MTVKFEVVDQGLWNAASLLPQLSKGKQRLAEDAGRLFDFAQARMDEGFTFDDLPPGFGWERSYFFKVVRELRKIGRDGSFALPCVPQGSRGLWRYRLTADHSMTVCWREHRLGVTVSVLETQLWVASTMCNATEATTTEGKSWRMTYKLLGRLCEDVSEMCAGLAV